MSFNNISLFFFGVNTSIPLFSNPFSKNSLLMLYIVPTNPIFYKHFSSLKMFN